MREEDRRGEAGGASGGGSLGIFFFRSGIPAAGPALWGNLPSVCGLWVFPGCSAAGV